MTERRDTEAELRAGADAFDREYYATFGRYPAESPLAGTTPASTRRRDAIQALIDRGATQGERDAAQAALYRLEHPSHVETDRMQRGGNYARDTLAGSDE